MSPYIWIPLIWFLCYIACLLLYWDIIKKELVEKSGMIQIVGEKYMMNVYAFILIVLWPMLVWGSLLEFVGVISPED